MQLGNCLDRRLSGQFIFGCGETALIRSDCLLKPAGSGTFQSNAELLRNERASDIGFPGRGCWRGCRHVIYTLLRWKQEPTMSVLW